MILCDAQGIFQEIIPIEPHLDNTVVESIEEFLSETVSSVLTISENRIKIGQTNSKLVAKIAGFGKHDSTMKSRGLNESAILPDSYESRYLKTVLGSSYETFNVSESIVIAKGDTILILESAEMEYGQ